MLSLSPSDALNPLYVQGHEEQRNFRIWTKILSIPNLHGTIFPSQILDGTKKKIWFQVHLYTCDSNVKTERWGRIFESPMYIGNLVPQNNICSPNQNLGHIKNLRRTENLVPVTSNWDPKFNPKNLRVNTMPHGMNYTG